MKPDHELTPYTRITSRWIKDLNISRNTIKVLEENTGRKISDIPHSNMLTDRSPKARDIKERINKWDLIKINRFFRAKETNQQTNLGEVFNFLIFLFFWHPYESDVGKFGDVPKSS